MTSFKRTSFPKSALLGLALALVMLGFTGCLDTDTPPAAGSLRPSGGKVLERIPLRAGDSIIVQLTGTPTSMDPIPMLISESGTISVANINTPIEAAGKTPRELEDIIRTNLVPNIYSFANVTVTPSRRYFYVSGQINGVGGQGTGQQVYPDDGITVYGAISAAGGFNDFADKTDVTVDGLDGHVYHVNVLKAIKHPEWDMPVYPGDRIYVERKGFAKTFIPQ